MRTITLSEFDLGYIRVALALAAYNDKKAGYKHSVAEYRRILEDFRARAPSESELSDILGIPYPSH
jgi:hypothetical protein